MTGVFLAQARKQARKQAQQMYEAGRDALTLSGRQYKFKSTTSPSFTRNHITHHITYKTGKKMKTEILNEL